MTAINDKSRDSLFVFTDDGTIKKIPVTTGADDGEFIEIVSGLNDGDIVVESHFDNLTDGLKAEHILEGDEQLGR